MDDLEGNELVDEIVDAVERLARASIGAIMVLERDVSPRNSSKVVPVSKRVSERTCWSASSLRTGRCTTAQS
jgi:DNA integrity scanning protein DisA with diadenylate cyclase activity